MKLLLFFLLMEFSVILFVVVLIQVAPKIWSTSGKILYIQSQEFWLLTFVGVLAILSINFSFRKISEMTKNESFKNPFIQIALFVCLITVFGSTSIISSVYSTPFPLVSEETFFQNTSTKFFCNRLGEFEQPVSGQFLDCELRIAFLNGTNHTISNLKQKMSNYLSDQDKESYVGYMRPEIYTYDEDKKYSIYIFKGVRPKIIGEGLNNLYFNFQYYNKNILEEENTYPISFVAISLSDYYDRQNQKLSFMITAISLGLFSSLVGVRNFMDIWDRNKRRK